MHIKKSLVVAGAVASVGLASVTGIGMASAATNSSGGNLVDKIAQTFNLNKDDVQKVFDEDKVARQAERTAEMSERLQDAVDDGKITAAQKTLIESKMKEQQAARQAEADSLKEWADGQGISMQYLMGGMRHGDDNRLQDAVDDGKITAEQKSTIEAKQDELEEKRQSDREALEQWAEDNGIDKRYLMIGMGGGHGPAGPGGSAPTATEN